MSKITTCSACDTPTAGTPTMGEFHLACVERLLADARRTIRSPR